MHAFKAVPNDGAGGVPAPVSNNRPGTIWLTKAEVAARLRVSEGWVRDHASGRRKPHLPGTKMGKHWKFRLEAIERWERELEAMWS